MNVYETDLDRAKRLTFNEVRAGRIYPWVMGDVEQRDRFNRALDIRKTFYLVKDKENG